MLPLKFFKFARGVQYNFLPVFMENMFHALKCNYLNLYILWFNAQSDAFVASRYKKSTAAPNTKHSSREKGIEEQNI